MIDRQTVTDLAEKWVEKKDGYFLVDVMIEADNRIVVEIDHADGVWIDDCVELSRFIESNLDRDIEDYELEVGSAGVGQPFKVMQQYINHIGKEVEVLPKSGAKIKGILTAVHEDGIVLMAKCKITEPGAKRPKLVDSELSMKFSEINYTKYVISLK